MFTASRIYLNPPPPAAPTQGPSIDDAIRILQESSRRTVEYINELQAENARLRKALEERPEKPCNKSCGPGYCYCKDAK